MCLKEMKGYCDAKTEAMMSMTFTTIFMMLCGIVNSLMALLINLEPVVQCMSSHMVYFFAHLSDQKIKEFITAASQENHVVGTVL